MILREIEICVMGRGKMANFDSEETMNKYEEQRNELEKIQLDNTVVESTDVMTGDKDRSRFLYYQLKMSLRKAGRVDIIVSFLMESGVRMILWGREDFVQ